MGDVTKVLIVEDEPLVRSVFATTLADSGFHVVAAEDGRAGLDLFAQEHPDAVLLDLRMPEMDGLDVLTALVEKAPETPVIVVSGEGTMKDVVEALRRGAWDFVTKPVLDAEVLVRSIWRGLEKAKLMRENREYRQSLEKTNRALSRALEELRADHRGAERLQVQLLPPDEFPLGPYLCSRRIFPSLGLSGDFVDYFSLGERFAGFYVADVSGHGAASAFVTAIVSTLVQNQRAALAMGGDETALHPRRMLLHLDESLRAHQLTKYVTMFYAALDLQTGRLVYCNGGLFPFPIVWDGKETHVLDCPGGPLGLLAKPKLVQQEIMFPKHGRLLMVSDGVLELNPGKSNREKRDELRVLLARSGDIDQIVAGLEIDKQMALQDDIALLLVRGRHAHG